MAKFSFMWNLTSRLTLVMEWVIYRAVYPISCHTHWNVLAVFIFSNDDLFSVFHPCNKLHGWQTWLHYKPTSISLPGMEWVGDALRHEFTGVFLFFPFLTDNWSIIFGYLYSSHSLCKPQKSRLFRLIYKTGFLHNLYAQLLSKSHCCHCSE